MASWGRLESSFRIRRSKILRSDKAPQAQSPSTSTKMKSLSQTHLFDRSNREDWENKGRPESYTRALTRAMDILENYEPEPLPETAVKQIRTIVEEAEKEIALR